MESVPYENSVAAKIEREASLWVIRCDRGLSAKEQDDFCQWLTADSRHGQELASQRSNWTRLKLLADWRPEHSGHPNPDLLAPRESPVRRRMSSKAISFATGAVFLAAAAAFVIMANDIRAPKSALPHVILSPIEQRTLADGSIIELNRGAEISVLFTPNERRVRLERGEANFKVAKNPARPFVVSAHGIDIRAVGTAFNVRLERDTVDVVVTEGRIELKSAEATATPSHEAAAQPVATVDRGSRAVVAIKEAFLPDVRNVTSAQMDELLAWHPRFVDFTNVALESVVAEFNRRNAPLSIRFGDSSLGRTEVSASLRSDNVEGFIRLLEAGFGVNAERSGNSVVLRRAANR